MRMRKPILFVAALLALATGAFALHARLSWSPGAPVYDVPASLSATALPARLRTWDEHDAIVARLEGAPYVMELSSGNGALVFYGAHHANDPAHPQLADIERRWSAFKPTVALHEGRSRGFFISPLFDRLEGKGEPKMVHELARRDRVPMYTLEPAYAAEVAQLIGTYTPEQVALFFFTRVYWGESGGKANERLAKHLLAKRTDVEGLRGALRTLDDVDRIWKRDFAGHGDWRTLKGEPDGTYLGDIADASRRVRGEHMARTIVDLVRRGERVFAVVGSGNVIRTEWMIRAALGAPPAADQPAATRETVLSQPASERSGG